VSKSEKINPLTSEYVDLMFKKNPMHCREKWYCNRDKALIKYVENESFRVVFEFAGATGLLAEIFLKQYPRTERYIFSDYSRVACELAQSYLKGVPNIEIKVLDMCKDLDRISWEEIDLAISTAMEHFPKGVDYEILEHIKKGTHILWSLSDFDVPTGTHPHPYPDKEYIRERFKGYIDFRELNSFPGKVTLLYGVKK